MLRNLGPYFQPILSAILLFPLAAALFTVPFMVVNYRKYGGIALMRVIVVYSFILYSMCAFLLTVLPLPSREAVAAMAPRPILWVPFTDLTTGLRNAGFFDHGASAWLDPARWKQYLLSKDFFQILANVVMQVPLGFYLRYYFRCAWKRALLIGLLVSLFYEVTQLTGLFFIYPKAYRFASVDDLLNNTLGTMIGYAIAPLLSLLLPTRDQIDRISYRKGEHLTLIRRMLASLLDLAALAGVTAGAAALLRLIVPGTRLGEGSLAPLCFLGYFVLLPRLTKGCTPGQALLKLRLVQDSGGPPSLLQLFIRNMLLYIVEPLLASVAMSMLLGIVITLTAEGLDTLVFLLLLGSASAVLLAIVWFFLYSQMRWNAFPHGHFSRTHVVKPEAK